MKNRLAHLIELVQKIPEDCLDKAIDLIEGIVDDSDEDKPSPPCPHCKSDKVRRFGSANKRQRYRCNQCSKTYMQTTNTAMHGSHCGEAAWKQVIKDTVDGVSIKATAKNLMLSTDTVFNMRHKIMLALEAEEARNPTVLSVVCELDDTFVLESYKGTKLPKGFWRKPRKHGAVAQKPGISNEYVCISTGVSRGSGTLAKTVTRATPSKDDINTVFEGHIEPETLIMCDGAKGYNDLGERNNCDVIVVKEKKGFTHTNTASSFHCFIKDRYTQYKGVATKYLNRYNALFSKLFRNSDNAVNEIYDLLRKSDGQHHHSVSDVRGLNLLEI